MMTSSLCSLSPEPRASWAKLGSGDETDSALGLIDILKNQSKLNKYLGSAYPKAIFLCKKFLDASEDFSNQSENIYAVVFCFSALMLLLLRFF